MKKIITILFVIIVIFIILCFCIRLYLKNNIILKISDYNAIIEKSDEMNPEISKNEMIIFRENDEYDLDDVILYKNYNGNYLIRRIVQIDEYGFIAKADNKDNVEPSEEIDTILGKVFYHSRLLGKIFK